MLVATHGRDPKGGFCLPGQNLLGKRERERERLREGGTVGSFFNGEYKLKANYLQSCGSWVILCKL